LGPTGFRFELLALDGDALRLGALVGTGDPYGQHAAASPVTCAGTLNDRRNDP
jgi:hypothetical protein